MGQKGFADMTELRTLRWGEYAITIRILAREGGRRATGREASDSRRKKMEKGLEDVNTTSFEAGWWGHKPKYTRGFLTRKIRKQILP